MKRFLSVAAFSIAAFVASCAPDFAYPQVVNPAQPATGVPTAGAGITVTGQQVGINYGVANSPFTGNLSAATVSTPSLSASAVVATVSTTLTGTVSGAGLDAYEKTQPQLQTVLNVAALRTTNCVPGLIYATQGYYAIADYGNAQYVCNGADTTSTDNGGTIIAAANSYRYYLQVANTINPKQFGAKGDGSTDDTTALQASITATPSRGTWFLPASTNPAVGYKITNTLNFLSKGGAIFDFNNQQINASSISAGTPDALYFLNDSEIVVKNVFLIGNVTHVNRGIFVDATSGNITVNSFWENIHIDSVNIGFQWGPATTFQTSDSFVNKLYLSGCNIGLYQMGQNSLAMHYGYVQVFLSTSIGARFEQGSAVVDFLNVAYNGTADIYFGNAAGTNGGYLTRVTINGGYTESSNAGEMWISSAAATDTNPFLGQVTIAGYRVTPFTATAQNVVNWNLNGDLTMTGISMDAGQQSPSLALGANTTYRTPRVTYAGEHSVAPSGATQVALTYAMTNSKQVVNIDATYLNAIDSWQNGGAANQGTIPQGVHTAKLSEFESTLQRIGNLTDAWMMRELPSQTVVNTVLSRPNVVTSAALERRDFWLNDGLIGFYANSTTTKTLTSANAVYSAVNYQNMTFGLITRNGTASVDQTDNTNIGGTSAVRIGVNGTGGGGPSFRVGGINTVATTDNLLDPHMIVGRYVSATSVTVDAVNLRTGFVSTATIVASVPAYSALTWTNGVNTDNLLAIKGPMFLYNRALSNIEVSSILQSALRLTSSWRNP